MKRSVAVLCAALIATGAAADSKPPHPAHVDRHAPAPPLPDLAFPGNALSLRVPIGLVGDRMRLDFKVANQHLAAELSLSQPSAIDPAALRRLGLSPSTGPAATATIAELSLRGLLFRGRSFQVTDLGRVGRETGTPIDMVVGPDLFRALVLELDYRGRRLIVMQPEAFQPPPAVAELPLRGPGLPVINGRIDGLKAALMLDPAAGDGLSLTPAFVQSHDLAKKWQLHALFARQDDGGGALLPCTHAASLELGIEGVARPLVLVRTPPGLGPDIDGMIGGGLLKAFDVIIDPGRAKLWLQRTSAADPEPVIDHAGLLIDRDAANLVVAAVRPDGPAALAGIHPGDVVEAVSGHKAGSEPFDAVRARLGGVPGTIVTLRLRRDSNPLTTRIVLADPLAAPLTP